jgi:hypothetical protein
MITIIIYTDSIEESVEAHPDGINFLERLVMECEPSMTSIYNKMMQLILDYGLMKKIEPIIRQEFLETAEEIQDEKRKRELEIRAIEKQLQKNKDVYLQQVRASEKTSLLPLGEPQTDGDEERLVGSIASIAVKEGAGGGNMSVKGAYDRYAAFEKYEKHKEVKVKNQIFYWDFWSDVQLEIQKL